MTTKKKRKPSHRAFLPRERESNSPVPSAARVKPARPAPEPLDPAKVAQVRRIKVVGTAALAVVFLWSYWPTIAELVRVWNREPDYSHGFLVAPLALFFLWCRRDSKPALSPTFAWPGLVLILAGTAMRVTGAALYIDAVDGWSLILWIAGAVWLIAGGHVFLWASSSIAFLWFMIPLPYRAERLISYPLQRIATKFSCWILQSLGQPALAEGNTILLGDHHLEVEEACSGLRIFMSVIALAMAYVILMRRTWWEKLIILASTLPIALIVNAIRISITGLLAQLVSSGAAAKFSHDLAGWIMIPMAAGLFAVVLWYLGRIFPMAEQLNIRSVVRKEKVTS